MRRLALGFDALLADIYWIRTVQYYGDAKLSTAEKKDYDLLYPLLDMTTTIGPPIQRRVPVRCHPALRGLPERAR